MGGQRTAYSHASDTGWRNDQGPTARHKQTEAQRQVAREVAERQRAKRENRPPQRESLGQFIKRNIAYILSVVAVAVIVLLLIVGIRAFAGLFNPGEGADGYISPYDWSKLEVSGDRYAYVVDGQTRSRLGVDVSENQGSIDWNAVASDGVEFAMVRLGYRGATEGDIYLDEQYWTNLEGARAAGIDCGIYFFSQAITTDEAIEEADFVIETLGGAQLQYPVAFDSEVLASQGITRTAGLTDDELSAIADAFCERIRQAGYSTVVYGNYYDMSSYDIATLNGGGVWWAEYDVTVPSNFTDIVMWQYTSNGHVAGIDTAVDLNVDLSNVL